MRGEERWRREVCLDESSGTHRFRKLSVRQFYVSLILRNPGLQAGMLQVAGAETPSFTSDSHIDDHCPPSSIG